MVLFLDIILHLDAYLGAIVSHFGNGTYLIIGFIIFCETGLVIAPFLPGDSLLFASGAFASQGFLGVWKLFFIITLAAVLGDLVNYHVGAYFGPKIFYSETARFFKKEHIRRTNNFYKKYGGKTIILARFVPIVRTFAPLVAGVGAMSYWRFAGYNIIGAVLWATTFIFSGFYFGDLKIVKENFSIFILLVIFISILPGFFEYFRSRKTKHPSI